MKVEVEASEIRSGKIEKISLVDHGANQSPFKILKTEEIKEQPSTMKDKLAKFFGTQDDENRIAALFVRKSVAREWLPLIKEHGFRVEKDHAEMEGDVLILKQEGFSPEVEGSIIALNKDVALQLNRVSKYFDPYPESDSFDENVKAAAFFPGLNSAFESLSASVWNVLNKSETTEDASTGVAKQVKAFAAHITNLVNELPTTVFKMEQESLTKEFGPSTVSESDTKITVTTGEDKTMSDSTVLKEAMAGDLDGLLDEAPAADKALEKADEAAEDAGTPTEVIVEKGGDEGAPKTGGSPGNPVVESTSDTGAVALDEGGVPAGFRKEERIVKELVDGELVEKTQLWFINDESKEEIFGGWVEKAAEDTPVVDETEYTPAEKKLFEALGVMAKSMVEMKESVEKQNDKIEAVEKTAGEAKETAEDTVVIAVAPDLDESLASLAGHKTIRKAADAANAEEVDLWKGALPMLEGDAA